MPWRDANRTPSHYTVTVWAGSDMYTQMRVPIENRDDSQKEYEYVSRNLQARMEDDFGKGVELVRRAPMSYEINVAHVVIEA